MKQPVERFKPGSGDVGRAGHARYIGRTRKKIDGTAPKSGTGSLGSEDPFQANASTAGGFGDNVLAKSGGSAVGGFENKWLRLVIADFPGLGAHRANCIIAANYIKAEPCEENHRNGENRGFPRGEREERSGA